MKKVIIVFSVILVLVIAGIFFALANLDKLVARAIETHGSAATQTEVSVSGVSISLKEGRGTINGLKIKSPEGYDIGDAFSLDDITLDIDIQSLRSEPIVIDEIRILAPTIRVQATETGKTNIQELRRNVEEHAGGGSGGSDGGSGGKEKRIRIKRFVFAEGSIEVDPTALGLERQMLVLPEIRLSDIGGEDGATPGEITRIVLEAVAKKAADKAAEAGAKESLRKKLIDKIGG
jgi:uncharacterized protein involved in outer membrane biogenesis